MKKYLVIVMLFLGICDTSIVSGQSRESLNNRNSDSMAIQLVKIYKIKYVLNKNQEASVLKCTKKYYKSIAALGNMQLEFEIRSKRLSEIDLMWKDELSKIMVKEKFQKLMDDDQKKANKIKEKKSQIKQSKSKG